MTSDYDSAAATVKTALDATYAAKSHTHSGYVSATKVTSWQSTPSDSNVPSEKLVKDYVDGLIGSAISYIVGSGS